MKNYSCSTVYPKQDMMTNLLRLLSILPMDVCCSNHSNKGDQAYSFVSLDENMIKIKNRRNNYAELDANKKRAHTVRTIMIGNPVGVGLVTSFLKKICSTHTKLWHLRCNRKIVKFFSHLNTHSKLKQHRFYEITKTKASCKLSVNLVTIKHL